MLVNPYLNFNGKTEKVFNFYKSVFGGDFAFLQRYKDLPTEENNGDRCVDQVPDSEGDKIMHVALYIGKSILMGADVPSNMDQVKAGTNLSLSIGTDSKEDADHFFKGLSESGKIQIPIQNMQWGDYYGMLIDKYDIQWMISFNANYDDKNDN